MGIWGQGNRSLLDAALEHRRQELSEARFRELSTDACECGGALRRRGLMRRAAPVTSLPKIVRVRPVQLALWGNA